MSDSRVTAHVAHVLPAFVVGTLAPEERREVLAHLPDCSICRAELAAWHTIQEALREPSPDLLADDTLLHAFWRRVDAAPGAAPSRLHAYREGNGNGRHRGRPFPFPSRYA